MENVRHIINKSMATFTWGGKCLTYYKYMHCYFCLWWKMVDKDEYSYVWLKSNKDIHCNFYLCIVFLKSNKVMFCLMIYVLHLPCICFCFLFAIFIFFSKLNILSNTLYLLCIYTALIYKRQLLAEICHFKIKKKNPIQFWY